MADRHFPKRLSNQEIVELLREGKYLVCLETGTITNKQGKQLTPYVGNEDGYLFVRIYKSPGRRTLPVAWVVWMAGNDMALPEGFEVHHVNRVVHDNSFNNLLGLSVIDHQKVHKVEEIPF